MARKIYCNGCNLEPKECIINGKKQWRWVVTSFIEDCFENGEDVVCNEKGKTMSDLFDKVDNDDVKIETDLEFLNQDLYDGIDGLYEY